MNKVSAARGVSAARHGNSNGHKSPKTILVIDADRDTANSLGIELDRTGYRSIVRSDPEQTMEALVQYPEIQAVLLDVQPPKNNGLILLRYIKLRRPDAGVIVMATPDNISKAAQATRLGAFAYVQKPVRLERVGRILKNYFAFQSDHPPADPRFASYLTCSPKIEKIFGYIRTISDKGYRIVIEGETGTGKELIAGIIHSLSPHREGPFVAVNLAALSSGLFEGELFGHRKGAFTGADRDHVGYLAAAQQGTLFLDEVGELKSIQQSKLLRALDTRRFSRVGETVEQEVNSGIVSASNRDLQREIKEGRFREDFYHRISDGKILLPPLRERPEDIELLAEYFRYKYCSQFDAPLKSFPPETMNRLRRHPLNGNVRELEGIVMHAILEQDGSLIRPLESSSPVQNNNGHGTNGDTLQEISRQKVMRTLDTCGGNRTEASRRLGVNRRTLQRWLKKQIGE